MASHPHCLNCGTALYDKFCPHCGQSAATERFRMKTILTRDLVRQALYLSEGFFSTIGMLFTHPGKGIRNFISGQRVRYTSYLALIAVLIIAFYAAESISNFRFASLISDPDDKAILANYDRLLRNYPKALFLSLIPLYALISWLFFKRAGYNYAEHIVLNAYRVSGTLVLNIGFLLLTLVVKDPDTLRHVDQVLGPMVVIYSVWVYQQIFSPVYQQKFLLVVRSFLCIMTALVVLLVLLMTYLVLAGN